ncbi:unnamed protein product [Blepharisma stoltei]|uniref:Uncharacterized protein n=1 Tax=Blepharisma stoltei TaxID=1481888 RepID=A0AAU9IAM0_9CILI|nr:unnamed protein product [Blepharisma stoltei]
MENLVDSSTKDEVGNTDLSQLGCVRKSLLAKAIQKAGAKNIKAGRGNPIMQDLVKIHEDYKSKSNEIKTKINDAKGTKEVLEENYDTVPKTQKKIELIELERKTVSPLKYKQKSPSKTVGPVAKVNLKPKEPQSNRSRPFSPERSPNSPQVKAGFTHKRNQTLPNSQPLSINLLNPSDSPKSSVYSRKSLSPKPKKEKPISLVILEKYFSDVCKSIASTTEINENLLRKARQMRVVLDDCLEAIPDLSLNFYSLMESSINDIQKIAISNDKADYRALANKLLQLASDLDENNIISSAEPASPRKQPEEVPQSENLAEIAVELKQKINRITPRVINIWQKILNPGNNIIDSICTSFLLLFSEVDKTISLPSSKARDSSAVNSMQKYAKNPGMVVQTTRQIFYFIENEMISCKIIKKIKQMLDKFTVDDVKATDRTLTAFILYEFLRTAIRFYEAFATAHYGPTIKEEKNHKIDGFNTEIKEVPKIEFKENQSEIIKMRKSIELGDQDFSNSTMENNLPRSQCVQFSSVSVSRPDIDEMINKVSMLIGDFRKSPSPLRMSDKAGVQRSYSDAKLQLNHRPQFSSKD